MKGDTKCAANAGRPTKTGDDRLHVPFQTASKGGRQACSVEVRASNIRDATTFFRQNWPMIESIARDGLLNRSSAVPDNQAALPR
jgi:hypothetical protein